MSDKSPQVVMTAMVCITALMLYALHLGKNGILFALALTVIGGLGGYTVGEERMKKLLSEA